MKRSARSPLLVTRCQGCQRRRACHPMPFWSWLCKQCIVRVLVAGFRALGHLAEQGR